MTDRHPQAERPRFAPFRCLLLLLACEAVAIECGCRREFWRRQADREVGALLTTVQDDPRWVLPDYSVIPNPRSRLYDPWNMDREPMPPDDPTAHRYMHYVDGMRGWPHWHRDGDVSTVENLTWADFLPRDADGTVILDLTGAVFVARLNSREFQSNLEEVYLSALDVTFERFRFDYQFYGGNSTFYTADGALRGGGQPLSTLNTTNNLEVQKLYSAGGTLVADIANSFVWQFSGTDQSAAFSIFDFSFFQPLLRFGGRARVLERLTRSERSLLSNVRQMQRYRQGFYCEIVAGISAGQGPQRQGGLFGGAGLEGFTGVGGGFGRVGGFGGGTGGGVVTAGAGAARAGGYLGLLQTALEIDNLAANVVGLRDSLAQLQAAYDAGRIDRFQVDLARQQLYNNQSQLLSRRAEYDTELDRFKILIGLPSGVRLRTSDPLLDRFRLIDPRLTYLQERTSDLLDELRSPAGEPLPAGYVGPQIEQLLAGVSAHLLRVDEDFRVLESKLPGRIANLEYLRGQPALASSGIDPGIYEPSRFRERVTEITADFQALKTALGLMHSRLNDVASRPRPPGRTLSGQLVGPLTEFSDLLLELSLVQARARLEAVDLVPVEITSQQAFTIALQNRLDYMNARTSLVDTWRLIEFNANPLMSDLNILINGDIATVGDNPVRFRDTTGQLTLGVQFDPPLTRVSERNIYRQTLIDYQQARRSFMLSGDRIQQELRLTLRNLELDKLNLELRRAAVQVAINQVDVTRLRLSQPPRPGEEVTLSNTTARDLVDALGNLLLVQNDFLSVWVNYEVLRLNLDFAMGTMLLTPQGLWVDPGPIHAERGYVPGARPEALPQGNEWLGPPIQQEPNERLLEEELPPPDMAEREGVGVQMVKFKVGVP